jgi:hypothetical protein
MSGAQQALETEGPEFIVEVIDDRQRLEEEDRDKRIAPEHTENDDDLHVPGEEIQSYRKKVQKRLASLTEKAHAERRAKELAAAARDDANRAVDSLAADNARLRQIAENAERIALEQAKQRTQAQLAKAQRETREALESGDPERIVEAQTALHRTVAEDDRLAQYRSPPQPQQSTQQPRQDPPQQRQVEIPKPDNRADQWAVENPWFGQDEEMTGTAYGVHEKLVKSGVNPASDDYYRRINEAMRRRYPEAFKAEDLPTTNGRGEEAGEQTSRAPRGASVVAPATRSVRTPRTVQLTASQVSLARRLGLTPEQYAVEVVKEAKSAE